MAKVRLQAQGLRVYCAHMDQNEFQPRLARIAHTTSPFILISFNHPVSNWSPYSVEWLDNDQWIATNVERRGLGFILRHYPKLCLQRLWNAIKTVRIASVPPEIRTMAPAENKGEALLAEPAYSVLLGDFEIETSNEYKTHPLRFSFLWTYFLQKECIVTC
jgi:hypothetical protein